MNHHSLDVIEKAQFVTCLDKAHPLISHLQTSSDAGALQDQHKSILANKAHPGTSQLSGSSGDSVQDEHKSILANRVLHGNGSQQNSCNRWFDHAVQVTLINTLAMHIGRDF